MSTHQGNRSGNTTTIPMVDVNDQDKLIPPSGYCDDVEARAKDPPPYIQMNRDGSDQQPFDNTCTLVGAVLVTVFCCVPFGIVAIIHTMTARVKHAYGDSYGTMKASRSAKRWILLTALTGIFVFVTLVVCELVMINKYIQLMETQQQLQAQAAHELQQQLLPNIPAETGEYGV